MDPKNNLFIIIKGRHSYLWESQSYSFPPLWFLFFYSIAIIAKVPLYIRFLFTFIIYKTY